MTPPDTGIALDEDAGCSGCDEVIVDLPARDVAQDPVRSTLYASIPGSDPTYGNEVVAIDPETGAVQWSVLVGSDPGPLAVSDDGSVLYVGLDGAAAVRRVDLETRTAGLEFVLGNDRFSGPLYAGDIEPLPGLPSAVAVSLRRDSSSGSSEGVAIFDDGVPRAERLEDFSSPGLLEAESATRLYGLRGTGSELSQLSVDVDGVRRDWAVRDLFGSYATDIQLSGGEIYATNGAVVDPPAMRLLGTFSASGPLALEPASSRVYFLQSGSFRRAQALVAFDRTTFRNVGTLPLDDRDWENPRRLFRFGSDGFAIFLTGDTFDRTGSRIILLRAPSLVSP